MSRSIQQGAWQSKALSCADGSSHPQIGSVVGQFQAVGFSMIPGTQIPAMVFTAPIEQPLADFTPQAKGMRASPAAAASRVAVDRADKDNSPNTSSKTRVADNSGSKALEESCEQALTLETFEGELPSVGSEGHFDGSCKRCAFFPKGRCQNGKDCSHCHFPHEARSRLRKHGASRSRKANSTPEPTLPEAAMTNDECFSEVMLFLSEPPSVASEETAPAAAAIDQPESDDKTEALATKAKEDLQKAIMARFQSALEEVCEAHGSKPCDTADLDTTQSVSTRCDCEETHDQKGTPSETSEASDSEVSSMQESAVASPRGCSTPKGTRESCKRDGLTSSPTSWQAVQRSRKSASLETCTTSEVSRMTRSLLNKLTEERFESLCSQLLALPLSTPEQLAVVVAEIFLKATTENGFRSLYTQLCMRLDIHLSSQTNAIGGKAFRKALVNECQATFERSLQPPDATLFENLKGDDCFEMEMKVKTRILGNMRLIGDLLVRRLLAPKLLPPIVHELLNCDEAGLEALIALLMVVSPEFETKPSLYQAPLRDAFAALSRKMNEKAVCSRLCCQIHDLLDAKARGWAPRSVSA